MPLVSILVPSYNHAQFLAACLDSVLGQTLADWELVLVDDGSVDESVGIARTFMQSDPRIQVHVNERNLGTYGTLQKALELSRGSLIAVLNSDDLWAPEKLALQVELLEKHPQSAFCYTLGWMVSDTGEVRQGEDVHADWPTSELHDLFPRLLYENRVLASSVVFRREGLRFDPSLRYSGDWVALLEASSRGPAACVKERVTFWRQHSTNTYTQSPEQVLEEIRVREAIKGVSPHGALELECQALNALALAPLHAYFGNWPGAFVNSLGGIGSRGQASTARKRFVFSFLPTSIQRRHYWPEATLDDLPQWRQRLREQEPLQVKISR